MAKKRAKKRKTRLEKGQAYEYGKTHYKQKQQQQQSNILVL
jgi:hypothetical protein